MLPGGEGDAPGRGARLALGEPVGPAGEEGSRPLAIVREGCVADEAVDPEVGDINLKGVRTGAQGLADFEAERAVPENSEILLVEADFRNDSDLAEVERDPDMLARHGPACNRADGALLCIPEFRLPARGPEADHSANSGVGLVGNKEDIRIGSATMNPCQGGAVGWQLHGRGHLKPGQNFGRRNSGENLALPKAVRGGHGAIAFPPDLLADGLHFLFGGGKASEARGMQRLRTEHRGAGADQFTQLAGEGRSMERVVGQNKKMVAFAAGQDDVPVIRTVRLARMSVPQPS
jgi:hypothetical protein